MAEQRSIDNKIDELVDRTRRTETRLTKYLQERGFDTQTIKPIWLSGVVAVPSRHCAISDIREVVPAGWDGPVILRCKGDYIGQISFE